MKKNSNYSQSVKKLLKSVLLILLTIFMVSCSNENENIDDTLSENISSIQYFESKTSFESKMESIVENNYDQLNNENYDILSEVLNEDNIIGIGDYLIKVDVDSKAVYTLKKTYSSEYDDLKAMNLKNSNITQFSVNDDVLNILDGTTTAQKAACGSPASYDYDYDSTSGNNRSLSLSATYKASGIYFSLTYRCIPSNSDSGYSSLDEWDTSYTTVNCVNYSSYGISEYGDGEHEGSFTGGVYFGLNPLASFHCFIVCSSSAGTVDVTIES